MGVVQVQRMAELFNLAEALAKQPRPKGPNLAIVTNAGGPGVLAIDSLIESGGHLATLSPETLAALDQLLPPHWSHANPVDVLGDATPQCYAKCVEITAQAPECDGLLAILAPQAMTDPTETALQANRRSTLQRQADSCELDGGQPGHNRHRHSQQPRNSDLRLSRKCCANFSLHVAIQRRLASVVRNAVAEPCRRRSCRLQAGGRFIATSAAIGPHAVDRGRVEAIAGHLRDSDGGNGECHQRRRSSAVRQKIGYPVVLKLLSNTITHKTDVGGVKLNLQTDGEVSAAYEAIANSVEKTAGPGHFDGVTVQPMIRRSGYELILGSKIDPQFGPVLLFGSGGQLVEIYRDRALALPPLTSTLARRMMERTKIYRALQGIRGQKPVDLTALEQILVRFGQLVLEQPRISEIDINPLLASGDGLLALDARVVMHPSTLRRRRPAAAGNSALPAAICQPVVGRPMGASC